MKAKKVPNNVRFVFIINERYLPNPHLVELGRRRSPRSKDIRYLEPNVLYCPPSMSTILREIKNPSSSINDIHRRLIYEKYSSILFKLLEDEDEDKTKTTEFWTEEAISTVIDYEIGVKMETKSRRETRSVHNEMCRIKFNCMFRRRVRMKMESYLFSCFMEDLSRSISTLNYLMN